METWEGKARRWIIFRWAYLGGGGKAGSGHRVGRGPHVSARAHATAGAKSPSGARTSSTPSGYCLLAPAALPPTVTRMDSRRTSAPLLRTPPSPPPDRLLLPNGPGRLLGIHDYCHMSTLRYRGAMGGLKMPVTPSEMPLSQVPPAPPPCWLRPVIADDTPPSMTQ
jgi:hypothetical protein